MKSDVLKLLCDPITRDVLEFKTESDSRSHLQEFLVDPKTGHRFPIRDGIPIFLLKGEVAGSNQRYQTMYDRFAPFYDFSTWLYSRWKGMSVEARLREYLDELEVKEGDRLLEVSVGTGRNLQFQTFRLIKSWADDQCLAELKPHGRHEQIAESMAETNGLARQSSRLGNEH